MVGTFGVILYICIMADKIRLKEGYVLAKCCNPSPGDRLTGYFSHEGCLKVHRQDCAGLNKAPQDRLVTLAWEDILADERPRPAADYDDLDELDMRILQHHRVYGVDYSLMVARMLHIERQIAFDRHSKLRAMKLLERVDPVMIRYRKGVVDNKWIKHRNHTYYRLTKKGEQYLDCHLDSST